MTNFSSSSLNFLFQIQHNSIPKSPVDEAEDNRTAWPEWDFRLSTVVSSSSAGAVTDALGALVFDPSDNLLATGGIARKIRIYSVSSALLNPDANGAVFLDHATACDFYICTPAKLSSLRWKPGCGSRILGSGDYDGVVMEYDLERRVPVFERDEHGGRRVWSIDYSQWDPFLGASGSDDGTMQMWDQRCEDGECLGSVQPSKGRSPVCCVEFNQFSFNQRLVTAGCADRKLYGYDLRMMAEPLFVLDGHLNAVTYARFLDSRRVVTSGVDGCLKMWNTEDSSLVRTYRGHVNSKRFVGLSVWRSGGLLCCGSENNEVVVYDKRWSEPIWVYRCDPKSRVGWNDGFVGSVCWMQTGDEQCTLVAGGSDGVLRVFNGRKK